jgi:hypothetical protein
MIHPVTGLRTKLQVKMQEHTRKNQAHFMVREAAAIS